MTNSIQTIAMAPATPESTLARLLHERHSCRAFLPQPVARETVECALQIAQRTASWCNSQAWETVVVSGSAIERLRVALVEAATKGVAGDSDFPFPEEYSGVYLERRRECGFGLYQAVGVERGDHEGYMRQTLENFRLFGAPQLVVLSSPPGLGVYGAIDVGGYVQVLLLAMQSLGIAAIPQAALATHSTLLKTQLGIPDERRIVCGISFGYEDCDHPANGFRTRRASLGEVVSWRED